MKQENTLINSKKIEKLRIESENWNIGNATVVTEQPDMIQQILLDNHKVVLAMSKEIESLKISTGANKGQNGTDVKCPICKKNLVPGYTKIN